jgi:hypothetical protein
VRSGPHAIGPAPPRPASRRSPAHPALGPLRTTPRSPQPARAPCHLGPRRRRPHALAQPLTARPRPSGPPLSFPSRLRATAPETAGEITGDPFPPLACPDLGTPLNSPRDPPAPHLPPTRHPNPSAASAISPPGAESAPPRPRLSTTPEPRPSSAPAPPRRPDLPRAASLCSDRCSARSRAPTRTPPPSINAGAPARRHCSIRASVSTL